MNATLLIAVACVAVSARLCHGTPIQAALYQAKCTFTTPRNSSVAGTLTLSQDGSTITVTGTISGLKPAGKHGFHVHQTGDFSDDCTSAGAHYNPLNQVHAGPQDAMRHVGDWGNIVANDNGESQVNLSDNLASISGQYPILGRAIVVHAMEDDLGRGDFPDSKTTGHAGARAGCCVIGLAPESG